MKKVYFYFLFALCCISIKFKAQSCSLDLVGTTTVSTNSALSDMAIDASNKVYTLAFNAATKNIELKSGTIASSWTLVATVPTVTNTTVKPALAINKIGEIIAFIRDEPNGKVGKVYKSTGGAFTQIGGAISVGPVSDLSIAFSATNELYIAYTDVTPSNLATVKRWNGSAWLDVGTGGIASAGAAKFNSLIIDNTNTPILAYQDGAVGFATTVSKYNGTSWNPFFTSASGPTSSTTLRCATNGDYYLGYIEGSDASVVQKYDGSSWNQLGFNITGLSSGEGNYEMNIDPANSPYIIANTTSSMVTAYRFDGGTGWLQVPAGFINTNISTMVNIAFDKFGAPYFGYADVPNNNALIVKTLTSLVSIITQPNSTTLCNGNSGVFSITTGGPGSPTYNWQSNNSSGFLDVVAPYSQSSNILNVLANPSVNQDKIRCVVDIGCRNVISNTATLTVSSASIVSTSTNPTCFNTNNGAITTTVSGGVTPYNYSWNTGATTSSITSLFGNTYTLTVFDNAGCTTTTVVSLTSPPSINSSFSGNMTICNGSSTTLTITATGGTGALSYSWTPSASVSPTTGSVVTANPLANETYNVQVTDALGCVSTPTVYVTVLSSPTLTTNATASSLCQGNGTTISAVGADTYTWMPGNLNGASQLVTPSVGITTYTVLGTNTVTGCSSSATIAITVNALPTANAGTTRTLTCVNTSTTLTGSAVGAISYNWSGPGIVAGATTLSPTINLPGTYNFVSMSASGCISATSTVAVTQNTTTPSPTASTTGTITCYSPTVSVAGGPATGVTYQWSGPAFSSGTTFQNASVSSPGSYTLLVTNIVNGCTNTAVTSVTQNTTTPTVSANTTTSSICIGSSSTLTATGVGVNTYTWNPGNLSGATRTVTPLATTIYTVTGTNTVSGCSATSTVAITVNSLPTITAGPTKSLTCASSFTVVTCSSVGGTSYNWNGPGIISGYTTTNCNVGSAGIYTVFAISPFGCNSTNTTVLVVSNTTPPSVSASTTGTLSCSTSTVALNGGPASGVTYQWSGPGFSSGTSAQNAIANSAGTYTLKVTSSANSCTNAAITAVTQNTIAPTVTASNSSTLSCATTTASLLGTGGGTYNWSGPGIAFGGTTANPIVNLPGCYILTVTAANGCTASATSCVSQNTTTPSVNVSVTNTLDCTNPTATVIATTTVIAVMHSWTGPGIVSGASTANATVNQPGTYSVTSTNTITGCTALSTVIVAQDITLPSVSIISSPSIICSGNSSTLTANGAVTYTWSTAQTTSSISVSPTTTDSYTVYGTGTNGCVNSAIETITVNTTPILAITGNTNICNGSSTTLTGSGATSYTWDSGVNTTTISVTPTVTTTYTLNGDNGNGCSSQLPVTVSIIPNKAIGGVITNTAGATGGDVTLYKYTSTLSTWNSLAITPISGTYSFNNIDSGLYVLRATPTATNIQVTYADSAVSWQDATIIAHGCTNNTTQNIKLIALAPYIVGPGVLTGNIVEAAGYVPKMSQTAQPLVPGTPIGGIIVKGGKNPGGQMLVQTLTDAAGNYTLTGLPINTLPDDYFIFVDIPGLDTNSTYHHISITSTDPVINGLDFNVDAQYINPIGSVTSISNDNSVFENKITLFPNPANQKFTLEYELTQSANVLIELFDIVGHKVKTIAPNSFEEKNKHSHSTNIEDLSTGVYFVKVKINNSETTIKLILN